MNDKKKSHFRETKIARVIQVIETVTLAGDGTNAHPMYEVHQYWNPDGKLLAKAGFPDTEQNLSTLSSGQLLKELVNRSDVKVVEHHRTNNCISVSLQIGNFGCSEVPDFIMNDDAQDE